MASQRVPAAKERGGGWTGSSRGYGAAGGRGKGELGVRTGKQGSLGKRGEAVGPALQPVTACPFLQGEWDLQPLPEIVAPLPTPVPRCPASRTVVKLDGGQL